MGTVDKELNTIIPGPKKTLETLGFLDYLDVLSNKVWPTEPYNIRNSKVERMPKRVSLRVKKCSKKNRLSLSVS